MFPRKVIGKLCILLSAAVLAGACSRDTFADLPEPERTDPVPTYFGSDGRAWLGLRIQGSDDTPGTRAIGDEDEEGMDDMKVGFEDGTENAVNDVYILLFAGATEDEAKFASAYKATKDSEQDGNSQIYKTRAVWLNDANVEPGDKLWAFALVNNNDEVITTTGIDEQTGVTAIAFKDGTTLNSSSTLATLKEVTVGKHTDSSGNYLMTSAPLSSKPGGRYDPTEATISTLVPIPANAFYGTKEEALENPAVELFVERMAAKIEVKLKLPKETNKLLVAGNKRLEIHTLEVALDRYNTQSYLVRRFNDDWLGYHAQKAKSTGNPYRFVDEEKQTTAINTTHRTYWAEDINYSDTEAEGNTTGKELNDTTDFMPLYDDTEDNKVQTVKPWYVMENTFELEHQELEASTQIVLRAQIGPGTFYTIESTGEEFGDVVGPPKEELGTSASSSFARGTTRAGEDETDVKALDEYLRDWLMEEVEAVRTWVETYCESDPSYIVLTPSEPDKDGRVEITATQTRFAEGSTAIGAKAWNDDVKTAIEAELGKLVIKIYKNGYCYYRVPIRHFTEAQTPWELTKGMQHTTVSEIYLNKGTTATDQQKNDYLGRYGVVRNNWYELTIEEFTRIGSPTLTSVTDTDTADDNPSQFVSLKLSVLPWIQHTQPLLQ